MSSSGHLEVVLTRLGGRRGLIDGAVPLVVFVAVNALAGLIGPPSTTVWWAAGAALAAGASLLGARLAQGKPLGPAARGLGGLVVAVAFAALSGDPRDFFLPGIYVDAAYALALAASAVVGHPLIGHGYALLFGRDDTWRRDPRLRRVFAMTTLGWSAISAVRAGVQAGLYRADLTELLALAKLALGWPLTALAVVATVAAVRRATPSTPPREVRMAECGRRSPCRRPQPRGRRSRTQEAGKEADSVRTDHGLTVGPGPIPGPVHDRSSSMFSPHELAELGERLADEGTARHARALQEIACAVADQAPGVAAALRDRSAAEVFRQRAFAVACMVLLDPERRYTVAPAA